MIIGAEHDSGAVGKASALGSDIMRELSEQTELPRVLFAILICRSEVGHQYVDFQSVEQISRKLLWTDTEPVDAAVQHHMTFSATRSFPKSYLPRRIQHRHRTELLDGGNVCGCYTIEYRDPFGRHEICNCRSLAPMRDEEIATSGVAQSSHNFARSEAVTICLDRGAAYGTTLPLQEPPV